MSSYILSVIFLSLMLSSLAVAKANKSDQSEKNIQVKEAPAQQWADDGTKLGFSHLMNDLANLYAYRQVQSRYLRTSSDLIMSHFLNNTPLLQMAGIAVQQTLDQIVKTTIEKGNVSMTRVLKNDPNPFYNDLDKIFREVLLDAGRTQQEIDEARLYVTMGNVNAYTISGENNPIVIVLQTGLLKEVGFSYNKIITEDGVGREQFRAIKNRIKAVLAHENEHILAGHMNQSVSLMALDLEVMNYFSATPIIPDADDDSIKQLIPDFVSPGEKPAEHPSPMDKVRRDSFLNAVKNFRAMLADARTQDQDAVQEMLNDYLNLRISLVETNGEMDPAVLEQLHSLETAVPHSMDAKFLLKLFNEHLHPLDHREQEASADGGSYNSVRPRDAAAAHAVFGGEMLTTSPLDYANYIAEVESALTKKLKQNAEVYKLFNETDRQFLYGGTNDHAFSASRIQSIMGNAQEPDAIGIRNQFLRRVVLHDSLYDSAEKIQSNIDNIQKAIVTLEASLKEKMTPEGKKELEGYQNLIQSQENLKTQFSKNAEFMAQDIIKLISDLGLSGNSLRSNPRFVNLLDYQLARKNQLLRAFEVLEKIIAENQDPEIVEQAKLALADYKDDMMKTNLLLVDVQKALEKELPSATAEQKKSINSRLELVKASLDEKISRDKIAEIVTTMRTETKSLKRQTRISPDPEVAFRSSSIRSNYNNGTQELVDRKMKSKAKVPKMDLQSCNGLLILGSPSTK